MLLDVAVHSLDGDVHALANGAVREVGGLVPRSPTQIADVIDFDLQTATLGHSAILQIAVFSLES